MGLVVVSLLILVWSLDKQSDQHQESNSRGNHNNSVVVVECREKNTEICMDYIEAKVMLIMARVERPRLKISCNIKLATRGLPCNTSSTKLVLKYI